MANVASDPNSGFHGTIEFARIHLIQIVGWKYFWPSLLLAVAIAIGVPTFRAYRQWRRAWLSDLAEAAIAHMRRSKRKTRRFELKLLLSPRWLIRSSRHFTFRAIDGTTRYILRDFWVQLRTLYLPSAASVIAISFVLACTLFTPHPPRHILDFVHPRHLVHILTADLPSDVDTSKIFDGLIVVIIALIVFVAESIRGSRTPDEKRVLLKISKLWILALFVTLTPLGFLYPPPTGLTALLTIFVAILTVIGFANVLLSLIDVDANTEAQRSFLKDRVRAIVLDSARQRVGNRILFDKVGDGKEINLHSALSKSLLPDGPKNYVFVDVTQNGILADINLDELKQLAKFLDEQDRPPPVALAGEPRGAAGAAPDAPQALLREPPRALPALLRRYKEEFSDDSIFGRDKSVIALPKRLASNPLILGEVRGAVTRIFKFSDTQPPSVAFRREMQSTKDRLIAAIKDASLGIIDDLRQTFLLVAEEFLITLNDLGGGYSADQAREELNNFFGQWNEVRWLVQDVRELLIVAAGTDNTNIIGTIAYLPFAIAIRALQAGDNLLFQEFLKFSPFIYELGAAKPASSPVRSFMIDRSWRYLKELTDFYIDTALAEDASDD